MASAVAKLMAQFIGKLQGFFNFMRLQSGNQFVFVAMANMTKSQGVGSDRLDPGVFKFLLGLDLHRFIEDQIKHFFVLSGFGEFK